MNTDHIRGLIRERRLTIQKTADLLGLSDAGLRKKLNGITAFTVPEAQKLSEILNVPISSLF